MSHDGSTDPLKTLDRRARRTRRVLKDALLALVLEKGYDAVTVEDITQRADLGRTTFYLHYRDKEELLLEAIGSIANDLIARLPPSAWHVTVAGTGAVLGTAASGTMEAKPAAANERVKDAILITFLHAAENAQLYRIILRGEGATKARKRLQTIISQKASELVAESVQAGLAHPRLPAGIFADYFAGALMATITWWLESDLPYPPEEMAEMFRMLIFQGGLSVLGMER